MNRRFTTSLFAAVLGIGTLLSAHADTALETAYKAAGRVAEQGPTKVTMLDEATLDLPKGYAFIPKAESKQLLEAMGNNPSDNLIGMIMPLSEGANWFVDVSFDKAGYIKDDDAKDWDADDLLSSLKDGTEEDNKMRKERGIPELDVLGWVEKPSYESGSHHLVWSINTREKGAPSNQVQGVNYNTYALGRDGYISMNLVTGMDTVAQEKPEAKALLAALHFNNGKRYEDFDQKSDRMAAYGLAALVAGVGAKKLGLLAIIGAFLAKSFKLVLLALAGGAAAVRKFFGGKREG